MVIDGIPYLVNRETRIRLWLGDIILKELDTLLPLQWSLKFKCHRFTLILPHIVAYFKGHLVILRIEAFLWECNSSRISHHNLLFLRDCWMLQMPISNG